MAQAWTEDEENEFVRKHDHGTTTRRSHSTSKGTGRGEANSNKSPKKSICGYLKLVLAEEPDPKFLCSSGGNVLKEPVQSSCGHRFCKSCLDLRLEAPDPECQACIAEGESGKITDREACGFPDMAIRREMKQLDAKCPNETCDWKDKFSEYPNHEASCNFRQVLCNACSKWVRNDMLKEHKDPEKGDCLEAKCPFECDVNNTASHQVENVAQHTLVLLEKINEMKSQVENNQPSTASTEILHRIGEVERKMEEITSDTGEFTRQGRIIENYIGNITEESSLGAANATVPRGEFKKLQGKAVTNENIMAVLNRQMEKMLLDQNEMEHQRSLMNSLIERLQGQMTSLERSLALKEIELAEKTLRIEALESTTYNGEYVWKIADFSRKRQNAINGRTVSIFSAPFYTCKSGYKICARLYLNGDGMGKGTHLSLFFVVMRGQYDAILTWPFPYRVTFTLLSQTGSDHIVDGFRPDPSSSSFRRPTSDMNIASGMPNFCPISRLEEPNSPFVRDDTMFIKIKVLCDN